MLVNIMTVTKLQLSASRKFICPTCGRELGYIEGGAVAIVNGKVDMSATLPKHTCAHCGVYYQELLGSGFYDVFPLPPDKVKPKRKILPTGDLKPTILKREADGKCTCPRCGDRMDFIEGQPVRLVNGKPDMENVKEHFHCPYCDSIFRRIASTDYFQWSET